MKTKQTASIQPATLPSSYKNNIGEPEIHREPITLFPTRTGRLVLVNMPPEPVFTPFC